MRANAGVSDQLGEAPPVVFVGSTTPIFLVAHATVVMVWRPCYVGSHVHVTPKQSTHRQL